MHGPVGAQQPLPAASILLTGARSHPPTGRTHRRCALHTACMTTDGPLDPLLPITFRVTQWMVVDAVLDNAASNNRIDGDPLVESRAVALRRTGWEVTRAHPLAGRGRVGWPPDHAELRMALPLDSWQFVVEQVRHAIDTETSMRDPWDTVRDLSAIADLIERVIAAPAHEV